MTHETTRHRLDELLEDVQRDIDGATEEISQAVEKIESGERTDSEALLGEAITRLRLLSRRIDEFRTRQS